MQIKTEWRDEEVDPDLTDVLDGNLELFPDLSLPCDELCAELFDADTIWPDARELRNHDCMWAGLCVSEKHEKDSVRPERVILPPVQRRIIAPTSARSLLLPPPPQIPRMPERPETPLSENELDLDLPELGDLLEDLPSVEPSEVTGQVLYRQNQNQNQPCTVTAYITPNTDHCYFNTALPPEHPVHTDSLGVQTPSDSEEEIDVETVADSRKPCRSSCGVSNSFGLSSVNGGGTMPTAPTLQDRQELQRTVDAMVRRGRPSLSLVYDRRKRKRRLSSGEYTGECGRKAVKRKQYRRMQNKAKRRRHLVRNSSSDSEVESTERRSLHNNLERQRRIDLRNAFEELRVLLPDTAENERAAKVAILNYGALYCQDLEYSERKLQLEKVALKKHQERLRDKLSLLRRSLAKRR